MRLLAWFGRSLLLSAVLAVGSVLVVGCGDDNGANSYESVTIGGTTWMKKNLCGSAMEGNASNNCGKYGDLYNWSEAQFACPDGWGLPSHEDWQNLAKAVGGSATAGTKLKAKSGWNNDGNGTDDFGFSALPGGYYDRYDGLLSVGYAGSWWTGTRSGGATCSSLGSCYAYFWYTAYNSTAMQSGTSRIEDGRSVRCVK